MQLQIQLLQHLHAESQHMEQEREQRGSPSADTTEQTGETSAAGISRFGPIMESHYQSESCPGRPNEAPHGEGRPLHTGPGEGGMRERSQSD